MYFKQILGIILLPSTIFAISSKPSALHPDVGLTINEIVPKYGYPLETHEVITEDGYILTLHRIPHGVNNSNITLSRPAVLLMHGLLSSAVDYVNWGPINSLGFILAENGYDVWLGNQRGNTWSRKHVTLNPDVDKPQFFNFSFHDIGFYDLPAKIDYILNLTGQDGISYIGHSQGTSAFFAMAAERPEYNDKIKLMVALAPVAYMSNLVNPLVKLAADNEALLNQLIDIFHIDEFLSHSEVITNLGITYCGNETFQEICAAILFAIGGIDSPQLDRSKLAVLTSNAPAGSCIKQGKHYLQEYMSGNFCKYDYGIEGNLLMYGQETPPNYDISKITAPIVLHYSSNDWLASTIDVENLASQLPNLVALKLVSLPEFNHLDFLWAIDVVELLYNDVLGELNATN